MRDVKDLSKAQVTIVRKMYVAVQTVLTEQPRYSERDEFEVHDRACAAVAMALSITPRRVDEILSFYGA